MSTFAGRPYHSPLSFQAGPIPFHFDFIAGFAGIFVIVLIIFTRFLRVQREQERASSDWPLPAACRRADDSSGEAGDSRL